MRGKGRADIPNFLPSARLRGLLVPLIVRRNGTLGIHEIVAEETGYDGPQPCAVIETGDGAAALDAMLIEMAGVSAAEADAKATGTIKRQIIREYLDGAGRAH